MSDFSLDCSSLKGALKARISRTESELDAVIAKLEEVSIPSGLGTISKHEQGRFEDLFL
jgi:hypothetical protein